MSNNPAVREYTGFELYLEGVKIPTFNNITIRESEGMFPQATISFPATSGILKTLPGTIVQVFGPDPKEKHKEGPEGSMESNEKLLLFEGEITSEGYNKNAQGKTITFECRSFLGKWQTVTATPKDSIMTPEWRKASGQEIKEYFNLTQGDKPTQETNNTFGTAELALRKRLSSESFGRLNEMMEGIQLTQAGQFSDEITQILAEEEVTNGDLYYLIMFFLKKFELHDPYYGMLANSIGLSQSVSTWPNKGRLAPFKMKTILENFFQFTQDAGTMQQGSLSLMRGLQKILANMHYTLVAPSSYTASYQFWDKNMDAGKRKPVRAYFMPNLEQSPPAKFNVVLPHQIQNLSYSRAMMNEPTRTIGVTTYSFPTELTQLKGVTPFCTEPLLNITNDGVKNNQIGLTVEETYKGIAPNYASFNSYFTDVVKKLKEQGYGEGEKKEKLDQNSYKEEIQEPLNQLTIERHYQEKLSGRTTNVGVEWSPYRMAGVPGLIVQGDNLPSMTGVIAAVTTNISGSGRVSSTMTFRSTRLIHPDEEFEHPDYGDMISDLTIDPYVNSNPYLFDPGEYDFEKIGYDLYTFIGSGTLSEKGKIKDYCKLEDGGVFREAQNTIGNIEKRSDDHSILSLIRNKDGQTPGLEQEGEYQRSAKLTKNVFRATREIENIYNGIEDGRDIEQWSQELTHRRIITKGEYFSSIGINPNEAIDRPSNYKDAIELFSGTEMSRDLKLELEKAADKRGTKGTETRASLLREKKSIEKAITWVEAEIEKKANELEGADSAPDRILKLRKEIEALDKKLNKGYELDGVKKDGLNEQLKNINVKLGLNKYHKALKSGSKILANFEEEIFKVYNKTRKAHISVGFHKFIQSNLIASNDQSSAVRNNLNITT